MKNGRWLLSGLFLLLISGALTYQFGQTTTAPPKQSTDQTKDWQTRTVKGQELISQNWPKVRLKFDAAFKYIGTTNFILYNVARAEQHFFVDADQDKRIRRLYWVQFEGYLPDNTHSYNYRSPTKVNLGGLEFFADAYAREVGTGGRPDSDGAKAQAYLASQGYQLTSNQMLMQRLVHLVDEAKRNELMMIYMEDLSPLKLTAADLAPNGKAAAQWEEIAKGLLTRATQGVTLTR
ncbi:MAG TPA: hypothetical protein VFZ34_29335 [Blastocatellia bacterium]|nr:hypothetical protein [Blastocatellia bacterium]